MFNCLLVEPGHRAIKFNKWSGVRTDIYREGWHFKMPWLERAIIFDTRTHPRIISSITGSKGNAIAFFSLFLDLQMVNVKMRVLIKPDVAKLPDIYRYLGMDYDGRVLPSLGNEVLKSVIARYTATQLLTERE